MQGSDPPATVSGSTPAPRPSESLGAPGLMAPPWAWGLFALLFLVHLLDSTDRWLLPSVVRSLGQELALSDTQAGWLATVLLLAFAAWSPIVGFLADRYSRPRMLALGIAVWSIGTIGTSLASTYDQLVATRCLVGVGAATSGVIALTLLMDLFSRRSRARVLSGYYLAMPLGAAVGLNVGPALVRAADWHTAFLVVGAPGLLLALAVLALPDPVRGASEGVDEPRLRLHERIGPSHEDYIDLMVNSSYTYSVFALAFSMFAVAGLIFWLPSFLTLVHGIPRARAASVISLAVPAAMLVGIGVGGALVDRVSRARPRALFVIPAIALLGSIPLVLLTIFGKGQAVAVVGALGAVALVFANLGPCQAIIANVVMPNMRGVGCAVALAAAHLLGDIWSPSLMGWVADTFGQRDSMETPFGRVLASLGAIPMALPGHDPQNLSAALLTAIPALALAGAVMLAGARHLPREMSLMLAKLRAVPSRAARAGRPSTPASGATQGPADPMGRTTSRLPTDGNP